MVFSLPEFFLKGDDSDKANKAAAADSVSAVDVELSGSGVSRALFLCFARSCLLTEFSVAAGLCSFPFKFWLGK